ncbi:MAG: hypothetical protein P5680_27060, partial [Limnospira sp. PMC 737.11]|uniref:hypothetical protein n=1 Tax=Limnospira sp. PMC 737.11 TaxID=2981095 RepID=UPI0028E0C65E
AATGGIGEVIQVAAGTYDEDVTIDKAVTVTGAQAGVAVDDAARGTDESVIGGRVVITGEGASLLGFTLTKPSTSMDTGTGT